MNENLKIKDSTKHLILCEGRDEKTFFIFYLDHYKKIGYEKYNEIQLEDIGGINDLDKGMENWTYTSGYDQLKSFGVIRDAEKDSEGAIQSVRSSFEKINLETSEQCFKLKKNNNGPDTVFGILPGIKTNGKWENGTLEDLCLKILKDEQYASKMACVDEYLKLTQEKHKYKIKHLHKSRLHTYLSSNDKYIGSKIGEASKMGAFDFENENLSNFKAMFDSIVGY
ncbi:MAG: hypothetical protein HDT44_10595 [Ruminococcaceae bacterium]|nr:hypothetical protein [Oscillospiraceae bacterium]